MDREQIKAIAIEGTRLVKKYMENHEELISIYNLYLLLPDYKVE